VQDVALDLSTDVGVKLAEIPLSRGRNLNVVPQGSVPQFRHEVAE
jgi:hypothetical protein